MKLVNLNFLFSSFPKNIKNDLLDSFDTITTNYVLEKWEPSELNGGKFCEVVYTILSGHVNGLIPNNATKPKNMVAACKALENYPKTIPQSIRVLMPRMLVSMYDIRNNRGVAHVGSEVKPNHMDSMITLYLAKWVMAELVRIFHNTSTEEAQRIVENLVEKTSPWIWEIDNKMRILDTSHSFKDNTLLILYKLNNSVSETDLLKWVEYSTLGMFRTRILKPLHKGRLIEYNTETKAVIISPKGIDHVEKRLLTI